MASGPTLEKRPADAITHDGLIVPPADFPSTARDDFGGEADGTAAPADSSVYVRAAGVLTNRWLHGTVPAPWFADRVAGRRKHEDVRSLFRRTSAALGVGLYRELQHDTPDRDHLFEFVRCSLIRWQASLLTDGRPACLRVRRDPLTNVILGHVVQLLSETSEFQTPDLLGDIQRCVRWISSRRPQTPWAEAATICALVDAAPLVRDSSLLKVARTRLAVLLARQDEEGWFPERGGPDLGRLSLTIDALARLHGQTDWAELVEPLQRAVRFLGQVACPSNWEAAMHRASIAAFVSPYGVELMAGVSEEATALARQCREQLSTRSLEHFFGSSNDACVTLGATVCLAAIHARRVLPEAAKTQPETDGRVDFPRAGLCIISTEAYRAVVNYKRGGAIHVVWRNGTPVLDDPGVIVCRSHGRHKSSYRAPECTGETDGSVITCRGRLASRETDAERAVGALRSFLGLARHSQENHPARRRADRFVRRIEFRDEQVLIHDEVKCHRSCKSIVCQSPVPNADAFPFSAGSHSSPHRSPIFIEGGSHVQLDRVYHLGRLIETRVKRNKSAHDDD